ncbi:hypothetical protein WJX84_009215 [Apatococcus fuscideae]|uniref:MORN repeat-containing protein 5 n=1 Tax=Apatococcus fuscideae TaxID=2026836 RepID=A0AAW1SPT4_9CHLO
MSAEEDQNEAVTPADTSNPFAGKLVKSGLDAHKQNPDDPQWHLADSFHPYAPFPGNAIKWESYVYDDGTTYEGLMKEDIPHGKGVLTFGLGNDGSGGGGGGIQNAGVGDRYEGEFHSGFANGLGMYTSKSGEVYRGEWRHGLKHGCGAVHDFSPFYKAVEDGQDPQEAWKKLSTKVSDKATYGTWQGDQFSAKASEYVVNSCHIHEVRGVLEEMDTVLTKTRMFAHKPDGEVTWMALRDAQGNPAPVMQDPMHYPHGTGFLAPGPMGQCHPLPENEELKDEMRKHARNHARIFNMYNFDYDPAPKSDLVKAWKHFSKKVAKDTVLQQELAEVDARTARQEAREREARVARRKGRGGRMDPEDDDLPEPIDEVVEEEEDEEDDSGPIDESDLLASAEGSRLSFWLRTIDWQINARSILRFGMRWRCKTHWLQVAGTQCS